MGAYSRRGARQSVVQSCRTGRSSQEAPFRAADARARKTIAGGEHRDRALPARVAFRGRTGVKGPGRARPAAGKERVRHGNQKASWSLRRNRSVELPADIDGHKGWSGARGRQHRCSEAGVYNAVSSIRIIELMNQAGFPKGALNIVTGPGGVVGEELLKNPKIRRIAFTGESSTGKHVAEVACGDFKRVTLELGGSDPMIVCDDADIGKAITGAMVGRFWNAGQACLAVKRLFVFDKVYDEFVGSLVSKVARYEAGDGMTRAEKPRIRMGPLHTAGQRDEIEEQVKDAIDRGAKVLLGGARPEGEQYARGNFYLPTILENVAEDSRAVTEETFGPLLPVFRVTSLDEAIEKANRSIYGLGSSIWTKNLDNIETAVDRIEAGNVWVNSLHYGYDELPFGGVKASGFGREHGPEALEYYLEPKGVVITR